MRSWTSSRANSRRQIAAASVRRAAGHRPGAPDGHRLRAALLAHELDLELQADRPAEHEPAGLQRRVPDEAPILAVDLGPGREARALTQRRVGVGTVELELEGDQARDVPDGQLAIEPPTALPGPPAHGRRAEGDLWVLVHVEEIRRAHVAVALRGVRVHAAGLDL